MIPGRIARRAVAVLVGALITSCHHQVELARPDWPQAQPGDRIFVRAHDGTDYDLRQFYFTPQMLVAVDGRLARPGEVARVIRLEIGIPLDSITAIRVERLDVKATALLTASAATAAWILIAGGVFSEPPPEPKPPRPVSRPTSCPFIYSFDGNSYVFDSETYAGAVGRGLERTDVDNLEHLRPVGGRYRLVLANERDETEYTDALTLLVADHPPGTRAFPDDSGAVHVVGVGIQPTAQREFTVNLGGGAARTGWEVAFARPAGMTRAVLVVRARNTALGPFMLGHVLGLLGSDVYTWYSSMATNTAAHRDFTTMMRDNVALDVALRTSAGWTSATTLSTVGPAIGKTLVVPVDLSAAVGDSVYVKLESSPAMWTLESIELAPYVGPASTVTIAPERATTTSGVDVTSLLAGIDGRYHVALQGGRVNVEYRVPPVRAGTTRTVLAQTRGHYYVAPNDRAVPQKELVARLMTDRPFAQQYWAIEWLRQGQR